jgi:hypothetical protein
LQISRTRVLHHGAEWLTRVKEVRALLRRLFRSLAIVCGMLLAATTINIGPAYAASPVGGLDFDAYCLAKRLGFVVFFGQQGGYGWACSGTADRPAASRIDFTEACYMQHGPNTIDRNHEFNESRDGWWCWSTSGRRGSLNLDGWCKHLGHVGAESVGNTVFDWRCRTKGGFKVPPLVGIDVGPACHWQYGSGTIDRFADFFNKNTWECWG